MAHKFLKIRGILVTICGMRQLGEYSGHGVTHVVSIHEAGSSDDSGLRDRVRGCFPRASVFFSFFNDVLDCEQAGAPKIDHVRAILDFTGELKEGDVLLAHCAMGISRSTAAAYAILCQHSEPGSEARCFEAILEGRKGAYPNRLVIRWADEVLGRAGAMETAANRVFGRTRIGGI
jgi:predicted protein tyrosine phosphatase